jgi:hypothetical protein
MLRIKILASVVPLIVAGIFARERLGSTIHPCVSTAEASIQMAPTPWQVERRVSFTSDPALATVRIQIVDTPEMADFAVADDGETDETGGCYGTGPTEYVGISERSPATPIVIYLSRDDHADYRIFVSSKSFTPHEAAALIASTHAPEREFAAKSL